MGCAASAEAVTPDPAAAAVGRSRPVVPRRDGRGRRGGDAGREAGGAGAGPDGVAGVVISLVTVSRVTVSQRRQPAVWNQRSRSSPSGLARTKRYADHSSSVSDSGSAGYATSAWAP